MPETKKQHIKNNTRYPNKKLLRAKHFEMIRMQYEQKNFVPKVFKKYHREFQKKNYQNVHKSLKID